MTKEKPTPGKKNSNKVKDKDKHIMIQKGRIENMDRSFDIDYWQRLGPAAIFEAAWSMVVDYSLYSANKDVSKLRLQRAVGALQRQVR